MVCCCGRRVPSRASGSLVSPRARCAQGAVPSTNRALMRVSHVLAALACGAASAVELNCQVFDETMVCDNEKARLHRAEIRTCSG